MNAKLDCLGRCIEIENFCRYPEEEKSGNPYNCSFDIIVKSKNFSGRCDGCMYDYKEWKEFVEQLKSVVSNKSTKAEINEKEYGSRIVFLKDGTGHINVSGTIYGEETTHSLKFSFMTDQTFYTEFIKEIEKF